MNERNYCFMTKISLTFTFITNEIIRSELYILNLLKGHCRVNFSNFIFQRLENAQIEKWIFFPFCFGIIFLWTLCWAIIPKYRKITLLSGRQSPRDLVIGRGSKLSPCHTSVTVSTLWCVYKLCLYPTVYTLVCVHLYSILTMVHHTLVKDHLVLPTFVPFLWHVTKTCCQPYHETNSVCISLSLECNTLRCDRQPWW